MFELQTLMPFAATVTALGGAWLTVRKIAKDAAESRKAQEKDFIRMAREEDSVMKIKLEARIEGLKTELKNLEFNVNKDMDHIKDTYSSEIRNLGAKIEDLREELKNQHGQLVQLLTEMIKKSR